MKLDIIVSKGMRNFSFYHNVFKNLLLQSFLKVSACGTLIDITYHQLFFPFHFLCRDGQLLFPLYPFLKLTVFTSFWGFCCLNILNNGLVGAERHFQPFLSHIAATSSPTHVFPTFLTPVLHMTIFPSNCLLFHIDCLPIGGRQRMLATVTVTFVKREKECWPSWGSDSQSLDWQHPSLPWTVKYFK